MIFMNNYHDATSNVNLDTERFYSDFFPVEWLIDRTESNYKK